MKPPIHILIADDHAVLRAGLRLLLEADPQMEVVGEAGNGMEAVALSAELLPDIILLDLTMPGPGAEATIAHIREHCPQTRILILTMHDSEAYLRKMFEAGAAGYVVKRAADTELLSAIRAVNRGEIYVHPSLTKVLLEDMLSASQQQPIDRWDTLSEREQQVIHLVALGYTNREVADQLFLSVKTVETYRARAMEKLQMRSRVQLVRFALQKGLLSEPPA
ncbi:MAG: response regulator transcription factor [Chloroflexi bacterium]|nr:response regulator transcription factor [Chloroflexota bacterium]